MSDILSNLKPPPGGKHRSTRVGRGPGSGLGKTCGRGNKGQKSRSGIGGVLRGFEGGQMPLQRRLPKRGFKNPFRKEFEIVNVQDLQRFTEKSEVNPASLKKAGLAGSSLPVKILGKGEISCALTVMAHAFSATARNKIEKAGGEVVILTTK